VTTLAAPRRVAGLAAVLVAGPLWFLGRALLDGDPGQAAVAGGAGAVAGGVLLAVVLAPRLPAPSGRVGRAVLAPSRAALATLLVVWGLVGVAATVGVPAPVDGPAAVLGVIVGLPLALAYGAAVGLASAAGVGPAGLETAAVGAGVAASTAWTLVLVAAVESLLARLRAR
jgi:hypothetical protein